MKTLFLSGAMIAFLGLAVAPMSAQTQSTTIQVSKIVGKKVKSSQGEEIGVVKDVMIDRNTGCLAYTVLSTGGAAGARVTGGGKLVAVPWAVYSPTANATELTVTVDRERIYSAPVFDFARIDEYSRPEYITNVYSYYGVSQGAAAGAGVSTTTGATTTTGTAASPAATASSPTSPAATESPAATRAPAAATSPAGSPSPHATREARPARSPAGGASPAFTREPLTPSPKAARGRPEATRSPARGAATSPAETGRSPSEAASPGEKTKAPQHRERGKREAGTPSENPGE
jgi:sporulation protein YlmC with PRC-barrel domain